jgi:hypothetical protein
MKRHNLFLALFVSSLHLEGHVRGRFFTLCGKTKIVFFGVCAPFPQARTPKGVIRLCGLFGPNWHLIKVNNLTLGLIHSMAYLTVSRVGQEGSARKQKLKNGWLHQNT